VYLILSLWALWKEESATLQKISITQQ